MTENMKITYLRDDTVRITAVITDFDGTLLDPDSDILVVYDPAGTNMGTLSTTQVGTGTYRADYAIPSAGTAGLWKVSWKILSGTYPAREVAGFLVSEG